MFADVNPSVIAWARRARRIPAAVAARSAGVSEDLLRRFEDGTEQPTIAQLRKLAFAYRRPFPLFYLPQPPEDLARFPDLRRVFHAILEDDGLVDFDSLSPELWLAIRHALYLRSQFLDFAETPRRFGLSLPSNTDPAKVAVAIRSHLGVSLPEQAAHSEQYAALSLWRNSLYQAGVLVFQFPKVDVEEARGFCVRTDPLPIVGLNSSDSPRARLFTLLHEVAHLVLGADVPERVCNEVAGQALVPPGALRELVEQGGLLPPLGEKWSRLQLRSLGELFGVSSEVIARRLVTLCLMPMSEYHELRQDLQGSMKPGRSDPGGPTFYRVKLAQLGTRFVDDVREAHARGRLTPNEAARVLGVRGMQVEQLWRELAT